MSYELSHHGIKGQRWGIRRFQNKDGSLTPAGKKRRANDYSSEAKSMTNEELRSKINRMNLEKRYMDFSKGGGSKLSKTLDVLNKTTSAGSSSGKIAKDVYSLNDKNNKNVDLANKGMQLISKGSSAAKKIDNLVTSKKSFNNSRKKLENMSDSELKEIVNRMDLENQYTTLKRDTVSRGKATAMDILEIAGDILAVGASATAIAVSIKNLRK